MTDIQFNEEQQYRQTEPSVREPFLIRILVDTRIVSGRQQAEYVLLGVAIIASVIAIFFWNSDSKTRVPQREIDLIKNVDQSQFSQFKK